MAFNSAQDLIMGTLGRVQDLRELSNDNAVLNFSLAVTPRRKQGNEWVDDETIWTNVTLWGRDARAFAANDFKPGTQLLVHGTRRAVRRDAYTTSKGVEVPERVEQQLNADMVAVAVNPYTTIQVTQVNRNGNGSPVPPKAKAAPAPKQEQPAPTPSAAIDQTEDALTDDPFSQMDSDNGDDDLFDNMPF